eukprot:3390353-Amphidinium_carterae.1
MQALLAAGRPYSERLVKSRQYLCRGLNSLPATDAAQWKGKLQKTEQVKGAQGRIRVLLHLPIFSDILTSTYSSVSSRSFSTLLQGVICKGFIAMQHHLS